MYGAVAAALASAVLIGLVSLYARQREDTVIGALWAVGMAVGLLFFAKTPGYADPMSYLFGDILLISRNDLWQVAALDVLVVGLGLTLYNKFLAVCFDPEFADLRGIRVKLYYMLLLCLTALTVVLLMRVVGIVMVIALLTLPAAVAGHFSRRLWQMMLLAVLCCMVFVTVGLGLSYRYELTSGPAIIVLAAGVYLAVAVGFRLRKG
jgi:zinc transport system permease protein